MKKAAKIEYLPDKCTGCSICMLACSWARKKTHQPSCACIRVEVDEKTFGRTMLLDDALCNGCLSCVNSCPAEALVDVGRTSAKTAAGEGKNLD